MCTKWCRPTAVLTFYCIINFQLNGCTVFCVVVFCFTELRSCAVWMLCYEVTEKSLLKWLGENVSCPFFLNAVYILFFVFAATETDVRDTAAHFSCSRRAVANNKSPPTRRQYLYVLCALCLRDGCSGAGMWGTPSLLFSSEGLHPSQFY